MPAYLYSNVEFFGAYGISDYAFSCLIDAPDEQQALAWGNEVAKAYDAQYGLQPSGDRLSADKIVRKGEIELWDERRPRASVKLRCVVGQMPDFSPMSAS